MIVIFRTDASIQIGSGHVMRCLTLADSLQKQGVECHFICREHPGHLLSLIAEHGYQVHPLPVITQPSINKQEIPAYADWLGATQQEDAEQCQSILQAIQPEWLIVDHYAFDYRWQTQLRPYFNKIMVIDDLSDRLHDCDLLLDQTLGRSHYDYQEYVPEHCELLCGSQYALLRPEFAEWRESSLQRRQRKKLEHLLINLGGVDKDNITTQILQALEVCSLPDSCKITVVMGASAPWLEKVREQAKHLQWPTEVKIGVSNMAELMANSDLAIGAAGTTTWERCCVGLPTIILMLAENQKMIARSLQEADASIVINVEFLPDALMEVFGNLTLERISLLAVKASEITDGQGVGHVVKRIMAK